VPIVGFLSHVIIREPRSEKEVIESAPAGSGRGRRRRRQRQRGEGGGAEGQGEVRRDLVAVTCSRSLMRAYVGQTYN